MNNSYLKFTYNMTRFQIHWSRSLCNNCGLFVQTYCA